jgi:hypothetical protein
MMIKPSRSAQAFCSKKRDFERDLFSASRARLEQRFVDVNAVTFG